MRDFQASHWGEPDGDRLHTSVLMTEPVVELIKLYEPVILQHADKVRLVPHDHVHMTLAWLPKPIAADISAEQRAALVDAVRRHVLDCSEFRVWLGPVHVYADSVRLHATPDVGVDRLARTVRAAFREVFGDAAMPEPARFTPHISLAYGTADVDADELMRALAKVTGPESPYRPDLVALDIGEVVVYSTDTFAADPWQFNDAVTVPFDPDRAVDRGDVRARFPVLARRQDEFLAPWLDTIEIVMGGKFGLLRATTEVAPRLGPVLTAVARYAASYQHDCQHSRGRKIGVEHLAVWEAADAAHRTLGAGLAAAFPELNMQQLQWLADGLTGRVQVPR